MKSSPFRVDSDWLVKPGSRVRLAKLRSEAPKHLKEEQSADALKKHLARMDKVQERLYASAKSGLLIVLQGMDTAGKDGTIRHIFTGVNPQGCDVAAFKVPTAIEKRHDYLWRAHLAVPACGMIGIFNRSHYEDVLSPVVHGAISRKLAKQRFGEINDWEQMLADNGIAILKFFLHISKEEQTKRLQARLDDESKHWKLSASDFEERKFWPKYTAAYEEILSNTSKKHAPWFVIPSDQKWYRNLAISEVIADAMESMKLKFPEATVDVSKLKL